ncbi:MAG TPA: nucleotide exchange factor GrpE [Acetobacteraceae bacterium]|jgi:molecular chaperone GrpE (heat shock protein)|nr:nucleotide exchange factor GrpE [Acetobacteraceae bacterium]
MNEVSEQVASTEIQAGDSPEKEQGENPILALIAERVGAVERQVAFLPPQVRQLRDKVESLATSFTEPRLKALLLGLVGVYDLVAQLVRATEASQEDSGQNHLRNYRVLQSQLYMLLESNGITEITAEGAFDPLLHCALQSVPVDDPARDNLVLETIRPGFRTERAVLRYAEVVVAKHSPPSQVATGPATASEESDASALQGTDGSCE